MKKKKKWEKPRVEEIRWNRIRLLGPYPCVKATTWFPPGGTGCRAPTADYLFS